MGAQNLLELRQTDRHHTPVLHQLPRRRHRYRLRLAHNVSQTRHTEQRRCPMNYRTVTIGEIALVIICVFVALAYFNGFG